MDNQWSLDTRGDPLGKVRTFIKIIWLKSNLNGMLVTLDEGDGIHAFPQYISDLATIDQVNPFRPLMEINAARLIPSVLAEHPEGVIGALLRPCEMRALIEMTKHTSLNLGRLLTISVDCLGTLPADEYQWRRERIQKGLPTAETSDELAQEALKFARQGGIIPYRYRPACQVCASPAARNADINLHVLGLPVRQKILVTVDNPKIIDTIQMDDYANKNPDRALFSQHERILAQMSEHHARQMQEMKVSLGSLLPADVDALIQQLETCKECQACIDVCPICSVDHPTRDSDGHYDRFSVTRWLVSCAGCGMCEQSCPNHLPTAAIFAHIRQLLDQQFNYVPGSSIEDHLPTI